MKLIMYHRSRFAKFASFKLHFNILLQINIGIKTQLNVLNFESLTLIAQIRILFQLQNDDGMTFTATMPMFGEVKSQSLHF